MLEFRKAGGSRAVYAKSHNAVIPFRGQLGSCDDLRISYLAQDKLEALEGLKKTIIAAMPKIQKLLEKELLRIDKEIARAQNN